MLITLAVLSTITLTTLTAYSKLAPTVGLIDKPNERKLHTGQIPLVGGISICTALVLYLSHYQLIPNTETFAVCIAVLTAVGALDDKYDLNFKLRLFVQGMLSCVMMFQADITLSHLGNMFGLGQVDLGWFGYFVTVIAVIGAINAFNMIDGIDGLVGSMAIITFSSMGLLFYTVNEFELALFCFAIVATIIPYLLFNLGFFRTKRKVFMGDAGSMLIGFTVIWVLLLGTQKTDTYAFRPVTALWLIGLPLMDMAATMIRRMMNKVSPFRPDRGHYHHVLQDYGFSKTQTLIIMICQSSIYAIVGMMSDIANLPEFYMFSMFLAAFVLHLMLVKRLKR